MLRVTASEFQCDLRRLRQEAENGTPIIVTSRGRDNLVLLEYGAYQQLLARSGGSPSHQAACPPATSEARPPQHGNPAEASWSVPDITDIGHIPTAAAQAGVTLEQFSAIVDWTVAQNWIAEQEAKNEGSNQPYQHSPDGEESNYQINAIERADDEPC